MSTKPYDFKIEKAANGEDTLLIQNENLEYIYVHSKYEPSVMAKKLTEQYKIELESIIVLFGIGLGYELINIIKMTTSRNNILVLEPNQELIDMFLSNYKLDEMVDIATINFYSDIKEIEGIISNEIDMINSVFLSKYFNLAYSVIYPELHKRLYEITDDAFRVNIMYKNTVFKETYHWFDIMSRNYIDFLESYDMLKLKNLFKDKPAIIVSRGPSLEKNVQLLKEAKGKILILCVYTAYPVLMAHNIEPDFVLSIDSIQILEDIHKKNGFEPILLANDSTPSEIISGANNGVSYLVNNYKGIIPASLECTGKNFEYTDTGGSVACTAFSAAVTMGCNPIVLIGQDLAFTNNQTHAKGTLENEDINKITQFLTCEGYYGGELNTSEQLYNYRLWFEEKVEFYKDEIEVINATEGGANIKGAINKPLQYVIDTYAGEEYVDDTIKNSFTNNFLFTDSEKERLFHCQKEHILNLAKMLDLTVEAVDLSKKLERLYKYSDMPKQRSVLKIVEQLDKIDNKLDYYDNTLNYIYAVFQLSIFAKRLPLEGDFSEEVVIVKRNLMRYEKFVESLEFAMKTTFNSLKITNKKYAFESDLNKWLEDNFTETNVKLIKDYKSIELLTTYEVPNE